MSNRQTMRGAALLVALALPGLAVAGEPGWYAGIAVGDVSPDHDVLDVGIDVRRQTVDDEVGFKVIAGFHPLKWLAIEANYLDLGTAIGDLDVMCIPEAPVCGGTVDYDGTAFSLSALLSLSAGPVDFFARAGVARWSADIVEFSNQRLEDSGTDPVIGAGIQLRLRSFAARFEFERVDLGSSSADVASLGLIYNFQ
jgi:hypothetical protein